MILHFCDGPVLGCALLLAALGLDVFRARGGGELSDFNREGLVLGVGQHHAVVDQLWADGAEERRTRN